MTKAEIIDQVYGKTGLQKKDVAVIVEEVFEVMKKSILSRENIYIRGLGTFAIKHRASKTARNISKGTTLQIEERDVPSFKPSKSLIKGLNSK